MGQFRWSKQLSLLSLSSSSLLLLNLPQSRSILVRKRKRRQLEGVEEIGRGKSLCGPAQLTLQRETERDRKKDAKIVQSSSSSCGSSVYYSSTIEAFSRKLTRLSKKERVWKSFPKAAVFFQKKDFLSNSWLRRSKDRPTDRSSVCSSVHVHIKFLSCSDRRQRWRQSRRRSSRRRRRQRHFATATSSSASQSRLRRHTHGRSNSSLSVERRDIPPPSPRPRAFERLWNFCTAKHQKACFTSLFLQTLSRLEVPKHAHIHSQARNLERELRGKREREWSYYYYYN